MPDGLEHIATIIPRALDQWRREMRAGTRTAGTRTAWTLDLLWRQAVAETVAREQAPIRAAIQRDAEAVAALNRPKKKKTQPEDRRWERDLEAQLRARLAEIDARLTELDGEHEQPA